MCSPPSAFMAMTPPSVSWRRASAGPAGSGRMCAMTGRLPGLRRRRRSITPQATDKASIRRDIWPPAPASCRPIATAASSRCSTRRRRRCRLHRHFAWPMRGGASSSWLISRKMLGKAQEGQTGLSDRARGGQAPRHAVRDRARRQWPLRRRAARRAPGEEQAASRRHARLAAARALSRSAEVLKPMNYMLRRWDGFAGFLDDGRICLTNNCAERALRGIALGRRNWTFAGSQRGADPAAIMLTMITTCRLNDVDPKAWLADVLARIADHPASRLHELLPWEWKLLRQVDKAADQQAA